MRVPPRKPHPVSLEEIAKLTEALSPMDRGTAIAQAISHLLKK